MIPVGSVFFFSKPKNIYDRGSVWHTDTSTVKSNFGSYLTVAVVLDDSSIENGCLQIITKSHFINKISKQKANYKFNNNIKAPILKGDEIGNIEFMSNDRIVFSAPLLAIESVDEKGFFGRIWARIMFWIFSLFSFD